MRNREKDLVRDFLAGKMSLRTLIKGTGIKLLLNKHPYTDAMIANLDAFKEMTGMEVTYDVFPEDVYLDKVTAALSSGSSEYDAFMTGAYMTWTYGPAGWISDLNEWINDPAKTPPNYNFEDMLPGLRASTAWDGVPGSELGGEGAKQWCIPWGFEANNLAYNRNMFEQIGAKPPTNMDELIEVAARCTNEIDGVYGIGVRGSRSWATIHPGFLSAYANFGEKDLYSDGGAMFTAINTDGSKAFHQQWVQMMQDSGPRDWSSCKRQRGLCIHPSVVQVCTAAARVVAVDAVLPEDRPGQHVCGSDLGLPVDLSASHPVDRQGLLRGHQSRHRVRPSHCREFVVVDVPQDSDSAGPARHRGGDLAGIHLRLEQLRLRTQYGQIAAAIMLSIAPTLVLALFAQRYLVEGLSLGAVKG